MCLTVLESNKPILTEVRVADLVDLYRPGSRDWGWMEECLDLFSRDKAKTFRILERVLNEGIGFADDIQPILLGNDGRIWDGHHRICIAIELGIERVMVEM